MSAQPVCSMTGYGQARRPVCQDGADGGLAVIVVLKSVNHRFLDLRWQMPSEWEGLTGSLEARLRARLRRGHVSVRISIEGASGGGEPPTLSWNRDLAAAYAHVYAEVGRQLGMTEAAPSPAEVLRLPGVLQSNLAALPPEPPAAAIEGALAEALEQLCRLRALEGRATADDVLQRCAVIERGQLELQTWLSETGEERLTRLRERLDALIGGAAAPERLLQEAALLAERGDVSEELTRLAAHCTQLRRLLAAGGEVGKKLDFLAQEMNREVNTLLSKTSSGGEAALRMTALGLELKAEIEKIREQAQNLE